jgi:hypothetical protein
MEAIPHCLISPVFKPSFASPASRPPPPPPLPAGGTKLQDEVRSRLRRLKDDLQAAQYRLELVNEGLAAASTPSTVGRTAGRGSFSEAWGATPGTAVGRWVGEGTPAPKMPLLPAPQEESPAVAIEWRPSTTAAMAVAAAMATPATKRSVRFAIGSKGDGEGRGAIRPGTPASVTATKPIIPKPQHHAAVPTVPSSARGSNIADDGLRRPTTQQAQRVGGRSPSRGGALRSVNGPSPLRRFDLGSDSSDDDGEEEAADEGSGEGSNDNAYRRAGAPRLGLSGSLGPAYNAAPDPLSMLGVRPPQARLRRGGAGRRPSEAEEREFRRRAAALCIHVSPYFKRHKDR